MSLNGLKPKCPVAIKMVGYLITAARHKVKKFANDRATKAIGCATIVMNAPLNMVKQILSNHTQNSPVLHIRYQLVRPFHGTGQSTTQQNPHLHLVKT